MNLPSLMLVWIPVLSSCFCGNTSWSRVCCPSVVIVMSIYLFLNFYTFFKSVSPRIITSMWSSSKNCYSSIVLLMFSRNSILSSWLILQMITFSKKIWLAYFRSLVLLVFIRFVFHWPYCLWGIVLFIASIFGFN